MRISLGVPYVGAVTISSALPDGLAARGVDLAYGRDVVVRAATIELRPGLVTALIGPNGSGKSTLLRALARLHLPTTGAISFDDGTDVLSLDPRELARRVTLLAQSRSTPGGLSVRELVEYGRHPHRARWSGRDPGAEQAIARAMTLTGIEALADRPVQALSGGQAQRVWLASCLAQDTGLLLLDEPTTFLDLRYQIEILDVVRELADDHGIGVGLVLHDLDQAAAIADRVLLLEGGTVTADGAPHEVLTPENLSRAYGIRVDVDVDPVDGRISTRAVGRHNDVRPRATV
ncbi:iron complex transport system ATP-binding protein [Jiangella alba]|uniref:Iron complex transport system ATP-binding protein n=1 Tax=Jiangella alba TaxID=561176 RepID=A0A1H5IES2_9ACTN|nr:iron complex transport system ATP-binding protein [Jiangella alba]